MCCPWPNPIDSTQQCFRFPLFLDWTLQTASEVHTLSASATPSTLSSSPCPAGTPPPCWSSYGRAQTQSKLPIVSHCLVFNYTFIWPSFSSSRISHCLHRVAPQTSSLLSLPITFLFKPCPLLEFPPPISTYRIPFRKSPPTLLLLPQAFLPL